MEQVSELLASYQATLSTKDQEIFSQFLELDKKAVILKFHPFIWGNSASAYFSTISDTRYTLFKIPRIDQVLSQYERNKMIKLIHEFPLDLALNQVNYQERDNIYDPRFILLSIYHLLSPSNLINCVKFITLRGLSLALVATSSDDESVRSLAYSILSRFYQHLESSRNTSIVYFWTHFINSFRASLSSPEQKTSYLMTSSLALAVEVINNPKSPLFYPVKDFVTRKPVFDNESIAFFLLSLLNYNHLDWRLFQTTALGLLVHGLKDDSDYRICIEHNLYKTLLSLYLSEWTGKEAKLGILKFVQNCVQIVEFNRKLLVEDALLIWLSLVAINVSPNHVEAVKVINMINKSIRKSIEELNISDKMIIRSSKSLRKLLKTRKSENNFSI